MPPKRRRRFHGLYYHSSPPKVLPMNGNSNSSKTTGRDESKEAFVVKPSNIRIWIHDKDVGKLTRVLWAGHGNRLRTETSTNLRVKKFLEIVPYVLNVIKDVHQAVVDNNLDLLKAKTEPPVPPSLITTKDSNGLTVMHKAAGLAHTRIVEYLLKIWPGGATDIDSTGKTPLHWAASAKNNTRCYNLLVQAGADEEALDYRMKTASHYKSKPSDIDRSLLTIIPEAPRVPIESQPDWSSLVDEVGKLTDSQTDLSTKNENNNKEDHLEDPVKGNGINLLTSRSKASTIEDTSEPDDIADEQNNLTLEEQAIKDAIEDERIFEQEQSEKEARKNEDKNEDQHDEDNDENGNDEPLGSPTASIPATISADEVEDQLPNTKGDGEIPKEIDNSQGNDEKKVDEVSSTENSSHETSDTKDAPDSSKPEPLPEQQEELIQKSIEVPSVPGTSPTTEDEIPTQGPKEPEVSVPLQLPKAGKQLKADIQDDAQDHETEKRNEQSQSPINVEQDQILEQLNHDEHFEDHHEEPLKSRSAQDDKKTEEVKTEANQIENIEEDKARNHNTELAKKDECNESTEAEKTEKINVEADEKAGNIEATQIDKQAGDFNQGDEVVTSEKSKECTEKDGTEQQASAGSVEDKTTDTDTRTLSATSTHSKTPNGNANHDSSYTIYHSNKSSAASQRTSSSGAQSPNEEPATNGQKKKDSDEESDKDDAKDKIIPNGTIDENHNAIKQNGPGSLTPPSPALEYEGVVHGEADDNQVDRIQTIINSGDMEQLAALVLNGEGKKLFGTNSQQPEIQAFLDNVPSYLNKIRKVHQAARNGNIRDLQAALDRRKFAVAKDDISPDGATPLHVATIFGHASIIRYLGGRFPETTSATDENGRTALHYAATINDNGHFYNLLVNLGSNPKSIDKLGNSAEHYKDNRENFHKVFSYQKLLRVFGADENMENEMLTDQENTNIQNRLEIPLFRTEQGRYLAEGKCASTEHIPYDFQYELTTALGDPLIKGLTEIAEKRPSQPILFLANFLQNFATNNTNRFIQDNPQASTPQPQPQPQPSRQGTTTSVSGHLGQPTSYMNNSVAPSLTNQVNAVSEDLPSSPEVDDSSSNGDDRDEHGQSMLHFACARPHSRNALLTMIEESEVNIAYRDELYRTARDVSLQANQPANAKQIDHFILSLAAKGNLNFFESLVIEGYDHILDITDDQGTSIVEFCQSRGRDEIINFLEAIQQFEESREDLHQQIRLNNVPRVQQLTSGPDATQLIRAKNYFGRTAVHIAVLKENEQLVDYLTDVCRSALKIGDNLERTPLHYAMGINSVEKISRILIRKGAKRIVKDLKGRQPSYYFMNKADILRLQEEEEEDHGTE